VEDRVPPQVSDYAGRVLPQVVFLAVHVEAKYVEPFPYSPPVEEERQTWTCLPSPKLCRPFFPKKKHTPHVGRSARVRQLDEPTPPLPRVIFLQEQTAGFGFDEGTGGNSCCPRHHHDKYVTTVL
jgi:hypothetical protein